MQSDPDAPIPVFPRALARGAALLPPAPLGLPATLVARRVLDRHPGIIARLGPHAEKRFLIDPTDLPFSLLLTPAAPARIGVHRHPPDHDARIAGPIAALIGLVHGAWDGDALLFSRDLVIEGDTAAALALRNAIDDAELDLAAEIADIAGPFKGALDPAIALVERITGAPLRRVEDF